MPDHLILRTILGTWLHGASIDDTTGIGKSKHAGVEFVTKYITHDSLRAFALIRKVAQSDREEQSHLKINRSSDWLNTWLGREKKSYSIEALDALIIAWYHVASADDLITDGEKYVYSKIAIHFNYPEDRLKVLVGKLISGKPVTIVINPQESAKRINYNLKSADSVR